MSGVIADTLAAHQPREGVYRWMHGWQQVCSCRAADAHEPVAFTAAHQAEVLSGAGFVDGRALLDDLRGLAHDWQNPPPHPMGPDATYEIEGCAADLLAVAARYALPDPTPKEQP